MRLCKTARAEIADRYKISGRIFLLDATRLGIHPNDNSLTIFDCGSLVLAIPQI